MSVPDPRTAAPPRRPTVSEVAPLARVVVKHARDAFVNAREVADQWRDLNFTGPPDFGRAVEEYDAFLALLAGSGADVLTLPPESTAGVRGLTLDSIYARDASVETPHGMVIGCMGKPQRAAEPGAQRVAFERWGIAVAGAIEPPGRLEGGDVVWLTSRIVAVGQGYRTNDAGITQFRRLLGDSVDDVVAVPLPHWRGPGDVFHLMSVLSPVDRDLAVVYSRLLPVPFRERLIDLGYRFIEVPDDEFDTMGANVLALSPRRCVMVEGNPRTADLLERAGVEVLQYKGSEISVKGGGGPTCLTRPIDRQGQTD